MSLYERCLKKWGAEAQTIMAIEEASEFIKALTKLYRKGKGGEDSVAEEIADLRLMLDQIEYIYDLGEAVTYWHKVKVDRLEGLLMESP